MSDTERGFENPGLQGTTALVTGGAGFIGSHLVEELLGSGVRRVAIVDDLSLGRKRNLAGVTNREHVKLTIGDASDMPLLAAVCEADGPFDHCYNLAVLPLPHSLELPSVNVERNVAITTAVCELGRRGAFRRLIHCSSSEVYGTAQSVAMDEQHPVLPHTPYAAAKAATDFTALSYATTFGLAAVVVRPFNTYGERQNDGAYAGLIPAVVRAVEQRAAVTIHGDGEQTRDMSYVRDTAHGLALAAASDAAIGKTFNLGSGHETSVNDLVRLLLDALGQPDHPVIHGPPRAGDVRRLLADTRRAREHLDFQPQVTLSEGLKRTAAWYRSRPRDAVPR